KRGGGVIAKELDHTGERVRLVVVVDVQNAQDPPSALLHSEIQRARLVRPGLLNPTNRPCARHVVVDDRLRRVVRPTVDDQVLQALALLSSDVLEARRDEALAVENRRDDTQRDGRVLGQRSPTVQSATRCPACSTAPWSEGFSTGSSGAYRRTGRWASGSVCVG